MLILENEAKEKRCCGPEGCGNADKDGARYCIGSACMAWRWAHWSSLSQSNTADEFMPPTENGPPTMRPRVPEGEGWRQVYPPDERQWFGWTNWERPDYSRAQGCCGYAPDERFKDLRSARSAKARKLHASE